MKCPDDTYLEKICCLFQLQDTAMDQASEIFKVNEDHELLTALKIAGQSGQVERVDEISVKFEEHSEQLQEVLYTACWK